MLMQNPADLNAVHPAIVHFVRAYSGIACALRCVRLVGLSGTRLVSCGVVPVCFRYSWRHMAEEEYAKMDVARALGYIGKAKAAFAVCAAPSLTLFARSGWMTLRCLVVCSVWETWARLHVVPVASPFSERTTRTSCGCRSPINTYAAAAAGCSCFSGCCSSCLPFHLSVFLGGLFLP